MRYHMRPRAESLPRLLVLLLLSLLLRAGPAGADVVMLQAVKDNSLCDGATPRSNGIGEHLFVGRTNMSALRRAVLAFDVAAGVPAGSTIQGATLALTLSRTMAGPQMIELHRLSADWGEGASDAAANEGRCANPATGDATWVQRMFPGTPWTMPGGDFVMLASASATVGGAGVYTWGSTAPMVADVQGWLDTPASNFGWIVIGNEAGDQTTKRFDSRENATAGARPVLTIDYQPPGGQQATVYEAAVDPPDRCQIIQPANVIGSDPMTLTFTPAAGPLLFYQVDIDGDCLTESPGNTLRMVKDAVTPGDIIATY